MIPDVSYLRSAEHREPYLSGLRLPTGRRHDRYGRLAAILSTHVTVIRARAYGGLHHR